MNRQVKTPRHVTHMLMICVCLAFPLVVLGGCSSSSTEMGVNDPGGQTEASSTATASQSSSNDESSESQATINTDQRSSSLSDEKEADAASSIPQWLESELTEGRTLGQTKDTNGGLWIKRGETYFSVELLPVREEGDYEDEADGNYYGYFSVRPYRSISSGSSLVTKQDEVVRNVDYAPILKLSEGDQLVTTKSSRDIELNRVLGSEGYVYDDGHTIFKGIGKINDYREIDGVEVEETEEARLACLSERGIVYKEVINDIVSPEVTTITGGFFNGTEWTEETIKLDQQILFVQETPEIVLSVQETREGYFIVDTSSLEPGAYLAGSYYFEVV